MGIKRIPFIFRSASSVSQPQQIKNRWVEQRFS
ncbi:hypothetical protein VC_2327 [Vibrio cholerae O1 biovar El Tor str. N16961]|uniref:Uncharacterized protein n=2 Tax=Vibrio cholerae TaxID=666 RepID=Q9KPN9_VIBCH|nr:hypothetical protein VC_2327 [Vibrio cholerae O1 biovar El Tor str. N16961]ACP06551.1 hypothetical protein VCM66_2250 [Vibrio cholerae M66-2]CSC00074.1 Uncharacterised protein [Vibrio cholerae]